MRASKRHGVSVNDDGTLTGVDGVRRCLLRVPGLALDAHAEPEQDRYAYLFGALAASLPHKARLAVFIENRPADAMALVAGLRAQLAPVPYRPVAKILTKCYIVPDNYEVTVLQGAR